MKTKYQKLTRSEWLIGILGIILIPLAGMRAEYLNERQANQQPHLNYTSNMELTKEILDTLAPGEIFRVVTTRIQNVHESMLTKLTFVCIKGRHGGEDWAIYCGPSTGQPEDIARYGQKVQDADNIRSICPCDEEVLALYRH